MWHERNKVNLAKMQPEECTRISQMETPDQMFDKSWKITNNPTRCLMKSAHWSRWSENQSGNDDLPFRVTGSPKSDLCNEKTLKKNASYLPSILAVSRRVRCYKGCASVRHTRIPTGLRPRHQQCSRASTLQIGTVSSSARCGAIPFGTARHYGLTSQSLSLSLSPPPPVADDAVRAMLSSCSGFIPPATPLDIKAPPPPPPPPPPPRAPPLFRCLGNLPPDREPELPVRLRPSLAAASPLPDGTKAAFSNPPPYVFPPSRRDGNKQKKKGRWCGRRKHAH